LGLCELRLKKRGSNTKGVMSHGTAKYHEAR